MTSSETIRKLIEQTKEKCLEWVKESEDGVFFVDPLDGVEISAHYGNTHAAVGFLILGLKGGDKELEALAIRLLTSVINRWSVHSKLAGFHNDFNNFALCVAWKYLRDEYTDLAERIEKVVLCTADSLHDTVNWIPMRWYVNKCRYEWTKDTRYKDKCAECAAKIKSATYEDGFMDDRLPKGMSFNLQYDVATVAVLQFLRVNGEEIDIGKETGALLNAVAPDGDINYLGRGTNQVFAWGLWIYLLASAGLESDLEKALDYCAGKIPVMLEKNNLMLNEWDGEEKYLWWDYHHCSVYTAHFLFWLALAAEDYRKKAVVPALSDKHDSGMEIIREAGWFIVIFSGRTEYLAERGPMVAAIGLEDGRMLVKGAFGPWQGAFGNKYMVQDIVLRNSLGLLEVNLNRDYSKNRVLKRMHVNMKMVFSEKIKPGFGNITATPETTGLRITYRTEKPVRAIFNMPIMQAFDLNTNRATLVVDGTERKLNCNAMIKNQYGWCALYQSCECNGKTWTIKIS